MIKTAFVLLLTLGSHHAEVAMDSQKACFRALNDFYADGYIFTTELIEFRKSAECLDTKTGKIFDRWLNGTISEKNNETIQLHAH